MHVNPFDEPNVQENKDRTRALLEHYAHDRALPTEAVVPPDTEQVRGLLRRITPGDYLAVLSFLPRTPEWDHAVDALHAWLAERSGVVTTLGHGPSYLHSTGQLYKGGSDRGVFLMLTGDDPIDLPVPGQPYTFSMLKQAQALGDLQALQARSRRLLHLHLGSSPLEVLRTWLCP
jgi:hypothetical protein